MCGAIKGAARCSAKTAGKYSSPCQRETDVGMDLACGDIYQSGGNGGIALADFPEGYLDTVDLIICVLLSLAGGGFILAALLWMMKKRRETLKAEEPLSYVDDDIYWKNGWYNNPKDRRWMVQDRMCSSNYSLNMGKPGARYLAGIGIVAIVLVVLWMLIVFFKWILSIRSCRLKRLR